MDLVITRRTCAGEIADATLHPVLRRAYAARGVGQSHELTVPIEEIGWATREMRRVGSEIVVLDPPELRARIAEEARKMAALYAEPAGS